MLVEGERWSFGAWSFALESLASYVESLAEDMQVKMKQSQSISFCGLLFVGGSWISRKNTQILELHRAPPKIFC